MRFWRKFPPAKVWAGAAALFGAYFLTACDPKTQKQTAQTATDSLAAAPVKQNRYWNDLARYLAGLHPEKGSLLDSAEYRPEALQHFQYIEEKWRFKETHLLEKLSFWSKNETPAERKWTGDVFYPFSGPDFVTIHTLFPDAKCYTLFGLEIEGPLFDIHKVARERMPVNLENLRRSIEPIMSVSFFYTKEMSRDLYASDMKGTTPILLLFIARTGNEVLDVQRFRLSSNGAPIYLPPNDSTPCLAGELKPVGDTLITGVEITFRKNAQAPVQTLRYVGINAEDSKLSVVNRPLALFSTTKPAVSYLKAASYLLHNPHFSLIRNKILEVSQTVVEDDTGIPYHFFDKKQWKIIPYGDYTPPIAIFGSYFQPALDSFYKSSPDKKHIDFGLGYKCGYGPSNQIIARKIAK